MQYNYNTICNPSRSIKSTINILRRKRSLRYGYLRDLMIVWASSLYYSSIRLWVECSKDTAMDCNCSMNKDINPCRPRKDWVDGRRMSYRDPTCPFWHGSWDFSQAAHSIFNGSSFFRLRFSSPQLGAAMPRCLVSLGFGHCLHGNLLPPETIGPYYYHSALFRCVLTAKYCQHADSSHYQ